MRLPPINNIKSGNIQILEDGDTFLAGCQQFKRSNLSKEQASEMQNMLIKAKFS